MKQKVDHIQMVFLVSVGRSGSTLLQTILDAHTHISAPLESKFVLHLRTKYERVKNWDKKTIQQFVNDLFTNRKIRLFWNVKKADILKTFDSYEVNSFADACKIIYLSFPSVHPRNEVKLIIDKNPPYLRFLKELLVIFPDSRVIYLVRDPRATAYSRIKAFRGKSIYRVAGLWVLLNRKIITSIEKYHINAYRIYYEKMVKQPEVEIPKLMEFLGLDYQEKMLDAHKLLRPMVEQNAYLSLPHHKNVGNPINTESLAKWENELSTKNIRIANAICHDMARQLAYDVPKEKLTRSESFKFTLSKTRLALTKFNVTTLFKLPFWMRKTLFNLVSAFFDRRYKK